MIMTGLDQSRSTPMFYPRPGAAVTSLYWAKEWVYPDHRKKGK